MNQQSMHDEITSRKQGYSPDRVSVDDLIESRRTWVKIATFALLGAAVVAGIGFAATNYPTIAKFVSQAALAETNEAVQSPADTPFLQHTKQAGLEACSTIFPALGELLTNGATYSVQSAWNVDAADEHAVQALVGMNYATDGYSGPAAGVVFAAPNGSACEGAMIRIAPFSRPCSEIPQILPQGSKVTDNLQQVAVYALGGNGGQALLLPTGNACVVISVAAAAL